MADRVPPPWLDGGAQAAPPPPAPPSRWVKGMGSPNPAGRPKGVLDKRTKVTQALMDDAPAIARVVIEAALEGDLQACNIVLSRVAPSLKAQAERAAFDFDPTAPVTRQIEAVLAAIAAGALAPDVGQTVIAALGTLADARAVADLEARIITLEAKEVR